ncbi:MAG: VOC family protein [Pseudomonadota bacterium]
MSQLTLDHLAISAENLQDGIEYVESALGVDLQAGGKHAHFATHNALLGMDDGLYLEVIAIDPDAPAPKSPRWFDLDRFSGPVRPGNWICRTNDIAEFVAAHPEAGTPVKLSRGDLRWQMAVPDDGRLPYHNLFPAVIEWAGDVHPANTLASSGCSLHRLIIAHPQAQDLKATLEPLIDDSRLMFETGNQALRIEMQTPSGLRVLE